MKNDLRHLPSKAMHRKPTTISNTSMAHDLQHLLGYAKWRNFLNIVSKAKTACELADHPISEQAPFWAT